MVKGWLAESEFLREAPSAMQVLQVQALMTETVRQLRSMESNHKLPGECCHTRPELTVHIKGEAKRDYREHAGFPVIEPANFLDWCVEGGGKVKVETLKCGAEE